MEDELYDSKRKESSLPMLYFGLLFSQTIVSGAPFLFGAGSVILSLLLAFFLPDNSGNFQLSARSPTRRNSEFSFQSECEASGSELRDINASSDNAPLLSDTKPL